MMTAIQSRDALIGKVQALADSARYGSLLQALRDPGSYPPIEPRLARDDLDEIALATYSTDAEADPVLIQVAPTLWIEDTGYHQTLVTADSAADIIRGWDHGPNEAFPSLEDALVAYGLDPEIVEAPADYNGPCRVWRSPCYYPGTINAPRATWASDDDGVLEFAARSTAQAYIDAYYNEPSDYDGIKACNVLSHGQYAADELTIVEA